MTLQEYIAARREMRARMTQGEWKSVIGHDGAVLRKYLQRDAEHDAHLIGRDKFANADTDGIATIVNEYGRLLDALEALVAERALAYDGPMTMPDYDTLIRQSHERTAGAIAALLADAKEAGDV